MFSTSSNSKILFRIFVKNSPALPKTASRGGYFVARIMLGKTFLRIFTILAILISAFFAHAEWYQIDSPTNAKTFEALILGILNYIAPLTFALAAAAIIFAGFKYMMALGKPEAITKANKTLTYVLIGTALIVGAATIASAIINTIKQIR